MPGWRRARNGSPTWRRSHPSYQAFLDELETRLTNYEAQFEGPLSSPGGIPRLLRRPLLTIDPDNPPRQEHFVLAAVCLHYYRIPALAFLLVRDVLSYLTGMAVIVPQIDHRAKALEVMQTLYDRTMPSLRDSRILGRGPGIAMVAAAHPCRVL